MATKTKTKPKENAEAKNEKSEVQDGPILDLSDAAVKKMIKLNKKEGAVPGALLLDRNKTLNEWFRNRFSAVSMRTDP